MPREPYGWARRVLGRHRLCIGDLAAGLALTPGAARRRLIASGFPARRCEYVWRFRGRSYLRRVWSIPLETARRLMWEDAMRGVSPSMRAYIERVTPNDRENHP